MEMRGGSQEVERVAKCGRPGVQMLADVFHMYKGSGHHCGFEHFGAGRLGLVHVNDIPATPPRAEVTDADRVYPGDGLAPWKEILARLDGIDIIKFNEDGKIQALWGYWDPSVLE